MEKKVELKLAELRRNHGITQQKLAEIVGTSYQNISKWENGITLPDITILPLLAEYFHVSVDALLGLVPLSGSEYKKENTDTEEFWDNKLVYLANKQRINWNEDYLTFLIRDVWKIEKPINILDLGCGYGYMGLMLLQNLPEGSTYTGVDFSIELIQYGKKLFEHNNRTATWKAANILEFQAHNKYDMVICQSVLRHHGDSAPIITKMKECAVDNGWIICIDTNRELESDGLYIEGIPYEELCERNGSRKNWLAEYENKDRDYAAAIRNAFQMRKLGIRDIEVRMNDKVEFVCPEQVDYHEKVGYFRNFYSSWYNS